MKIVLLLLAVLIVAALLSRVPTRSASLRDVPVSRADRPQMGEEHEDHEPKHGGMFFMAMNNHHHLEGVLEAPGVFRVYVYDSYTKPLPLEQMKQIRGKVLVGDSDNPPELPLTLSRDGKTLEAALGGNAKLPLTLTLLMRFPGMTMEARPELFTFPFREFAKPSLTR